jgi:hypothetical protein
VRSVESCLTAPRATSSHSAPRRLASLTSCGRYCEVPLRDTDWVQSYASCGQDTPRAERKAITSP